MSGRNTYTLHKPVRKKFPRNPYRVSNIYIRVINLADLSSLSKYNDNYNDLLNFIDIFSSYVWSVLLKDKTGNWITSSLKSSFQNGKPITIQLDKGTEFVNWTMQRYLKRQFVNFCTSHIPDIKGAVIVRFKKSLKWRILNYFTKSNTYFYLYVIEKLLTCYSTSVHSVIGVPPSKVNPSNIYCLAKDELNVG